MCYNSSFFCDQRERLEIRVLESRSIFDKVYRKVAAHQNRNTHRLAGNLTKSLFGEIGSFCPALGCQSDVALTVD